MMKKTLVILSAILIGMILAGNAFADVDKISPKAEVPRQDVFVEWPADGNWKIGKTYETDTRKMAFFYPEGQSAKDWTEMGSVDIEYFTEGGIGLGTLARTIFLGTQQTCPEATWEIHRRFTHEPPYGQIIFEVRCPEFTDGHAELQLWSITWEKSGQFIVQYSLKAEEWPEEKWQEMLEVMRNVEVRDPKPETVAEEKEK